MIYEVVATKNDEEWWVECPAPDRAGKTCTTIFIGQFAELRARDYAEWMNSKQNPGAKKE